MRRLHPFAWAAVIAIGCIGAAFWLDAPARAWVVAHQTPPLRAAMERVSTYGDWPTHVGLGMALCAFAYLRGSKRWLRIFGAMVIACALAGLSARVIKITTGRARPSVRTEAAWNGPTLGAKYHAFPSGHTAASTAFFGVLALASWRIGAPLLALPLLIAFSRMYVAAHYLSDVVFAAVLGMACAGIVVRWMREADEGDASKRRMLNVQRPTSN